MTPDIGLDIGLRRVPLDVPLPAGRERKDPCPVHDGTRWHLFATDVPAADTFAVMHAVADDLAGPWDLRPPVAVTGLAGSCIAAPGVVAEDGVLHLFLQTEYCLVGGSVHHLVSYDGGDTFTPRGATLASVAGTADAGIYDPHPVRAGDACYLVYSAFSVVGQPDVHLARSDSWDGPWERLGPVLAHEQVWCHNQRGSTAYEWGLEGAQLLPLPDGRVLLNAVCFLPGADAGTRQRVFFAVADDLLGPYDVLGPVLEPPERGENGHACAVLHDDQLWLVFQERSRSEPVWRLGCARTPLTALTDRLAARLADRPVPTTDEHEEAA